MGGGGAGHFALGGGRSRPPNWGIPPINPFATGETPPCTGGVPRITPPLQRGIPSLNWGGGGSTPLAPSTPPPPDHSRGGSLHHRGIPLPLGLTWGLSLQDPRGTCTPQPPPACLDPLGPPLPAQSLPEYPTRRGATTALPQCRGGGGWALLHKARAVQELKASAPWGEQVRAGRGGTPTPPGMGKRGEQPQELGDTGMGRGGFSSA